MEDSVLSRDELYEGEWNSVLRELKKIEEMHLSKSNGKEEEIASKTNQNTHESSNGEKEEKTKSKANTDETLLKNKDESQSQWLSDINSDSDYDEEKSQPHQHKQNSSHHHDNDPDNESHSRRKKKRSKKKRKHRKRSRGRSKSPKNASVSENVENETPKISPEFTSTKISLFNFKRHQAVFKIYPKEAADWKLKNWIELLDGVSLRSDENDPFAIPIIDLLWCQEENVQKFVKPAADKHKDFFESRFIYDCYMNQKLMDLNKYKTGVSLLPKYDANLVLRKKLAWDEILTGKEHGKQENQRPVEKSKSTISKATPNHKNVPNESHRTKRLDDSKNLETPKNSENPKNSETPLKNLENPNPLSKSLTTEHKVKASQLRNPPKSLKKKIESQDPLETVISPAESVKTRTNLVHPSDKKSEKSSTSSACSSTSSSSSSSSSRVSSRTPTKSGGNSSRPFSLENMKKLVKQKELHASKNRSGKTTTEESEASEPEIEKPEQEKPEPEAEPDKLKSKPVPKPEVEKTTTTPLENEIPEEGFEGSAEFLNLKVNTVWWTVPEESLNVYFNESANGIPMEKPKEGTGPEVEEEEEDPFKDSEINFGDDQVQSEQIEPQPEQEISEPEPPEQQQQIQVPEVCKEQKTSEETEAETKTEGETEAEEETEKQSNDASSSTMAKTGVNYTKTESVALLNYICKNKLYRSLDFSMWQKISKNQVVPNRSWKSLRNHFNRRILVNLAHYGCSPRDKKKILKECELQQRNKTSQALKRLTHQEKNAKVKTNSSDLKPQKDDK